MIEFLKDFFRRRSLRKNASSEPTGIKPLREFKSAVVFVDVEDTSFDECKGAVMSFFRENNLRGDIFFFDFRKLNDGERLITSITNTVLKKDLNWFGRPSLEKVNRMLECNSDVFISLMDMTDYPLQYMAKCSKASFKIGRKQLTGNTFDMVISDPKDTPLTQVQIFDAIKTYLNKIQ